MKILSSAFEDNDPIPKRYSGEGDNLSPPIEIHDVPNDTVSWVIIMDDPDAPGGAFDHWIAWNISPQMEALHEAQRLKFQGTNGFGKVGYGGPMPPKGPMHHYHFRAYALDCLLKLPAGASKEQVENAMHGHILAVDHLIGTYKR